VTLGRREAVRIVVENLYTVRNEDPVSDRNPIQSPDFGCWTNKAPISNADAGVTGNDVDLTHEECIGSDLHIFGAKGIVDDGLTSERDVFRRHTSAAKTSDTDPFAQAHRQCEQRATKATDYAVQ
jgi:hypothetical protein